MSNNDRISVSAADMDQYLSEAQAQVKSAYPNLSTTTQSYAVTLAAENGPPNKKTGVWAAARLNSAGAAGASQMFKPAFSDAYKLLHGGPNLTGAALAAKWSEIQNDPKKAVLYGTAYMAVMEQTIKGWAEVKKGGITNDDASIRTIVTACYHLGYTDTRPLVKNAMSSGHWDLAAFVEGYNAKSAAINQKSGRLNAITGLPASGGSNNVSSGVTGSSNSGGSSAAGGQPETPTDFASAPGAEDALRNRTIPLSFDISKAIPNTPLQVIQEGLNLTSWYERDPSDAGGLVGNPRLREMSTPAWFELRLNRSDGTSLSGKDGGPIQVRLNVSLQTVNIRSQQIVSREPTATGLMVTFWGSQPDMLAGKGTTGAFINQFGLTAIMSNRLSPKASKWYSMICAAYKDPTQQSILLGPGGAGRDRFRVAAQDAFAEMLALFKNNGVTRFLPQEWAQGALNRVARGTQAYAQAEDVWMKDTKANEQTWSSAAGATGFQQHARAGDVYTRGYVVLKYKGRTYLGYFKTFNFTANAASPFKWDFDFTFRVLKSLHPLYVSG